MTPINITPVRGLDQVARWLAWLARWVSPARGAGAFWVTGGASFWDAWREPTSWTVRLGRLELVVDFATVDTREA